MTVCKTETADPETAKPATAKPKTTKPATAKPATFKSATAKPEPTVPRKTEESEDTNTVANIGAELAVYSEEFMEITDDSAAIAICDEIAELEGNLLQCYCLSFIGFDIKFTRGRQTSFSRLFVRISQSIS